MRRFGPVLAMVAVLAVLFHAGPQQALACSCASYPDATQRARALYDSADMILVGNVVSAVTGNDGEDVSARVEVEHLYKGESGRRLTVTTASHSAACGYEALLEEERHILVVHIDDGENEVGSCSSRSLAIDADENTHDLLRELAAISPPTEPSGSGAAGSVVFFVSLSLLALGATVALWAWVRRQARTAS